MTSASPRAIFIRRLIWGLLGIVLAALAWLCTANLRFLVDPFLRSATEATGREVSVTGGVYFDVLPRLGVRLEGLRVGNADWANAPHWISVGRATLNPDVGALFRASVRLHSLEFADTELNLERNEAGVGNWVLHSARQASGAGIGLAIDRVFVRQSRVAYRDAGQRAFALAIDSATLELAAADRARLALKAALGSTPVSTLIEVGPFSQAGERASWPMRLDVQSELGYLELNGSARAPWDWTTVAASFSLEPQKLAAWQSLLGLELPQLDRVAARGNLSTGPRRLTLADLSVHAGNSDAKGQIDVDWSGETLLLVVAAAADRLALDELLRSSAPEASEPDTLKPSLVPGADRALRALDIRLEASAAQVSGLRSPLHDVSLKAAVSAGRVTVERAVVGVDGERVTFAGDAWVDEAIRLQVSANAPRTDLNAALAVDVGAEGLAIDGSVWGKLVDVDEVVKLVDAVVPSTSSSGGSPGASWGLDVAYGQVHVARETLDDVKLRFTYVNGDMRMSAVSLHSGPTHVTGSAKVMLGNQGLLFNASARAGMVELGKTLPQWTALAQLRGHFAGARLAADAQADAWSQLLPKMRWQVEVDSADLEYHDEQGISSVVGLSQLRLRSDPQDGAHLACVVTYRGEPMDVGLTTLAIQKLFDRQSMLPLDLVVQPNGSRISATGEVYPGQDAIGAALKVRVESSDLGALERVLDIALPLRPPLTLNGVLTVQPEVIKLEDIHYVSSVSRGVGQASLAGVSSRPFAHVAFDFDELTLPFNGSDSAAPAPADARWIPEWVLPAERLRAFDADVRIDVAKVKLGQSSLGNLGIAVTLQDGLLRVERAHGVYAGATVEARGRLDVSGEVPTLSTSGALAGFDYGLALAARGAQRVQGKLDLGWDVTGRGADLRRLLGSLDGTVGIIGGEGRLPNRLLQLWAGDLMRLLWPGTWAADQSTQLNCLVARWDVVSGVAASDALLLDTADMTIAGSGVVNLTNEEVEIVMTPSPKDPSLFRVATPVRVSGTLAAPSVAVSKTATLTTLGKLVVGISNPAILVLLFGDVGSGYDNRCAAAVENRDKGQATDTKAPKRHRSLEKFIDELITQPSEPPDVLETP